MNEANRKKKAKRDRIILIVSAALLLLAILAAILIPMARHNNRLARAERILKEEGYNYVTRTGEGTDISTGNNDVLGRVDGQGGPKGEFITLVKFRDEEIAKLFYDALKDEYTLTLTAVQEGQYVYYGTRLTYELIK